MSLRLAAFRGEARDDLGFVCDHDESLRCCSTIFSRSSAPPRPLMRRSRLRSRRRRQSRDRVARLPPAEHRGSRASAQESPLLRRWRCSADLPARRRRASTRASRTRSQCCRSRVRGRSAAHFRSALAPPLLSVTHSVPPAEPPRWDRRQRRSSRSELERVDISDRFSHRTP